MRFHLKERHPLLFQALRNDDGSSSTSSSCASTSVPPGQQRIPELFRQQEPFSCNSSKWIKRMESVCYFLAEDTQPFDTVNGAGFQKLVHNLELTVGTSLLTGKLYLLPTCLEFTKVKGKLFEQNFSIHAKNFFYH